MEETITIREAITLIQEEAYAASGMNLYDVQAFFRSEKKRVSSFLSDKPDYLLTREEILKRGPSLTYIELDLPKRFDTIIPELPYQHPYYYPWLEDILRYHNEKLDRLTNPLPRLIVATAPTGRFNAIALPGKEESGILMEDGLMHVASHFSNQLAYFFYKKLNGNQYQENNIDYLKNEQQNNKPIFEYLAKVIWQYVIDGYSYLPPPIGSSSGDDFSIRHTLSTTFFFFVLEHESFHIQWWHKGQKRHSDTLKTKLNDLWNFYDKHLKEVVPSKLLFHEFEYIYHLQQEELLADYFAFSTVLKLGSKENTISASIKGGLLFFLIAQLIQHLLYSIEDKGFPERLYSYDTTILSLTAILTGESHPYAFQRKSSIQSLAQQIHPQYCTIIKEECDKMDFVFGEVQAILDQKLADCTIPPIPHPKWAYGKSGMV
jgi:hypothetical protein